MVKSGKRANKEAEGGGGVVGGRGNQGNGQIGGRIGKRRMGGEVGEVLNQGNGRIGGTQP